MTRLGPAARLVRGSAKIKQARRQAVRLVREFVEQSPNRGKVVITGREHYFDSHNELVSALGLKDKDLILSLNEFTQDQITVFLQKKGINQHVPDWLPSRPLLLGYLVVRGLLSVESRLSEPTTQISCISPKSWPARQFGGWIPGRPMVDAARAYNPD